MDRSAWYAGIHLSVAAIGNSGDDSSRKSDRHLHPQPEATYYAVYIFDHLLRFLGILLQSSDASAAIHRANSYRINSGAPADSADKPHVEDQRPSGSIGRVVRSNDEFQPEYRSKCHSGFARLLDSSHTADVCPRI